LGVFLFCLVWFFAVCAELESEKKRVKDAERSFAAAKLARRTTPAASTAARSAGCNKSTAKKRPKKSKQHPKNPKRNKNHYTKTLVGVRVIEVMGGTCDSQLKLRVRIPLSDKKQMMVHFLLHRTPEDKRVMIDAIRQFTNKRNAESAPLSDDDRTVCERFMKLLGAYAFCTLKALKPRNTQGSHEKQ
jgi:hypothetical protein